jgi:hypothetical protein
MPWRAHKALLAPRAPASSLAATQRAQWPPSLRLCSHSHPLALSTTVAVQRTTLKNCSNAFRRGGGGPCPSPRPPHDTRPAALCSPPSPRARGCAPGSAARPRHGRCTLSTCPLPAPCLAALPGPHRPGRPARAAAARARRARRPPAAAPAALCAAPRAHRPAGPPRGGRPRQRCCDRSRQATPRTAPPSHCAPLARRIALGQGSRGRARGALARRPRPQGRPAPSARCGRRPRLSPSPPPQICEFPVPPRARGALPYHPCSRRPRPARLLAPCGAGGTLLPASRPPGASNPAASSSPPNRRAAPAEMSQRRRRARGPQHCRLGQTRAAVGRWHVRVFFVRPCKGGLKDLKP